MSTLHVVKQILLWGLAERLFLLREAFKGIHLYLHSLSYVSHSAQRRSFMSQTQWKLKQQDWSDLRKPFRAIRSNSCTWKWPFHSLDEAWLNDKVFQRDGGTDFQKEVMNARDASTPLGVHTSWKPLKAPISPDRLVQRSSLEKGQVQLRWASWPSTGRLADTKRQNAISLGT